MQYIQRDGIDDQFRSEKNNLGGIESYPAPDIIYASPLCNELLALRSLNIHEAKGSLTAHMLLQTLHRLEEYQRRRVQFDGGQVPWTVENVVGAKSSVSEIFYAPTMLCGTMFGHCVLRHRLFLSSKKL
eukprot:6203566-Pleurochrysis_carterae.AAC.3